MSKPFSPATKTLEYRGHFIVSRRVSPGFFYACAEVGKGFSGPRREPLIAAVKEHLKSLDYVKTLGVDIGDAFPQQL
jgi:uncharacterized protein YbbK (DUF523 family)